MVAIAAKFVAKMVAKFVAKMVAIVAKFVAQVRDPGLAAARHSILTPVKLSFQPHVIHLRLQSALAIEGAKTAPPTAALQSPLFPPHTQRISDFLLSKRGPNLVRSFGVPPNLVRGNKFESEHEVLEFDFVGIPSSPSRYANFHQSFPEPL
ncbi:hypothetical protein AVEN_39590-1 [Araneus ventricosus]|uniref:Uncharacterized protein n=1 Tax=Araneus ventricosus TaxID=182803 RepID=A0A4Y2HL32_ARAVE|nr:hypothetical protein AVEN_39590-1 [Araneus ventricosus]